MFTLTRFLVRKQCFLDVESLHVGRFAKFLRHETELSYDGIPESHKIPTLSSTSKKHYIPSNRMPAQPRGPPAPLPLANSLPRIRFRGANGSSRWRDGAALSDTAIWGRYQPLLLGE